MTSKQEYEERRINVRLLAYWEKKRGGRRMPTEMDMDPADIADLWEYCFKINAGDIGKQSLRFSYFGRAIKEIYNEVFIKTDENGASMPDIEGFIKGYQRVLEKGEPSSSSGELISPGGDSFKYRQVLLPLGDGTKVTTVFGGMRYLRVVNYK